jgi:hypothetical protein
MPLTQVQWLVLERAHTKTPDHAWAASTPERATALLGCQALTLTLKPAKRWHRRVTKNKPTRLRARIVGESTVAWEVSSHAKLKDSRGPGVDLLSEHSWDDILLEHLFFSGWETAPYTVDDSGRVWEVWPNNLVLPADPGAVPPRPRRPPPTQRVRALGVDVRVLGDTKICSPCFVTWCGEQDGPPTDITGDRAKTGPVAMATARTSERHGFADFRELPPLDNVRALCLCKGVFALTSRGVWFCTTAGGSSAPFQGFRAWELVSFLRSQTLIAAL